LISLYLEMKRGVGVELVEGSWWVSGVTLRLRSLFVNCIIRTSIEEEMRVRMRYDNQYGGEDVSDNL
jgi:hypothetical protein